MDKLKKIGGDWDFDAVIIKVGNDIYYVFEQGAKITIDAVEYTAEAVVQAGNNAYQALSNFVSGNFKDTILPDVIGGAFDQTLADIGAMVAGGQMVDVEKNLTKLVNNIGYNFTAQSFIQTQAVNELAIKLNNITINNIGGKNYMSLCTGGDIALNAKRTALPDGGYTYTGYNSKGEKITVTENQTMLGGYGGAVSIPHANDNTLFSYKKSA